MASTDRDRITIAIAAMGGQGGGVLADWILAMGEQSGYYVQVTSVPGVAQRTGATIYYLELFPEGRATQAPVLALMPVPGDIDVVIAAELAEAGRAVQRGIITPDRTSLIASDHRAYAIAEKSAMGDGRSSSAEIKQAIQAAAKSIVCFDMQTLAEQHHTVISATLFGALAGSAVLPFTTEQFEAAITGTGKSVANNLAAFRAAFAIASGATPVTQEADRVAELPTIPSASDPTVAALLKRLEGDFSSAVQQTALNGLRRLLDYQDPAYASQYLDRVGSIQTLDRENTGEARLTETVARHLALWMSYEDTIRVADIKIRRERFDRCRTEVQADEDQLMYLTEYMHPRIEEVADTLPKGIGSWLLTTRWARNFLTNFILRERKIHTSKLSGYLLLYGLSSLQRYRRSTYRFATEQQRITSWLARIESLAPVNYELAIEIGRCQNLIKGYGDTHARGVKNFNRIMDAVDQSPVTERTTALVVELRAAALADEDGATLAESLKRVA